LLAGFGSAALVRASVRRPHLTIGIWIALSASCGVASLFLEFNDDPANIRARGNRGVETQERLAKTFGQSFDFVLLVASGATAEEALVKSESLVPRLQQLAEQEIIGGYQSVSTFVPSPPAQREVIKRLLPVAEERDRIAASLARAAVRHGFREDAFDAYAQTLRDALGVMEPLRIESADDPALVLLRERFLQRSGKRWLSVAYLYPPRGRWGRSVAPELMDIAASTPGVTLTGVNVVSGALRRIARADAIRATAAGLVAVFVLFWFVFRSARTAGLLFLPFVAGSLGMTGIMAIARMPFNPLNIFVGLMLVAVGTDYAVYMIERLRESPSAFTTGAPETAKAVTMAALTTIVGYGSFALSHYPGLRSIGYASTFGVAISGLAAITLLPAILTLMQRAPTPR
jgi:predicted exporter